jgi:lipid A disaccharide synthetase
MNPARLKEAFSSICSNTEERNTILQGYTELRTLLGQGGAAVKTAKEIIRLLH